MAARFGSWALIPFDGVGRPDDVRIRGRVVQPGAVVAGHPGDGVLHNLDKMRRRFLARPGVGVRVRVRCGGVAGEAFSDAEGYFALTLLPDPPLPGDRHRHPIHFELAAHGGGGVEADVFVAPRDARFGVISDIDDTIVRTEATDRLRMARIVLLTGAHDRLPFSGVSAFYQALHRGRPGESVRPIYYVSSSSWHLYDVMRDFMRIHGLPPGPILLRAMSLSRRSLFDQRRHDHKLERIEEIFGAAPGLPFLLIGDTGQRDAELYCQVAERHPGRVPAIYLRDVLPAPGRRATLRGVADRVARVGTELVLADDTLDAARHAVRRGFIEPDALTPIALAAEADEPRAVVPSLTRELVKWLARRARPHLPGLRR